MDNIEVIKVLVPNPPEIIKVLVTGPAGPAGDGLPNVEDWRGYGGDNSDTGTLKNAVAAAKAAGGMLLRVPARTYTLEEELLIDESHISLIGEGAGYPRSTVAALQASPRSKFLWGGAAGGTIVRFNCPPGMEQRIGGGLQGIQLDGNNFSAARGLVLESWLHGYFFDITVIACSESQVRLAIVNYALATSVADLQRNLFEHCYVTTYAEDVYLTSMAHGFHLTGGSSVQTGNTSFNTFIDCHATMAKGIGWKLENSDNNYFYMISGGSRVDPATQFGVELGSDDQDSIPSPLLGPGVARHNVFYGAQVRFHARAGQTGGNSSISNTIIGLPRSNNVPRPVIEEPAGGSPPATLNYWDTTGNTSIKTLGLTEAVAPLPTVTPGLTQLYIDAEAGPVKLKDSTGAIRVLAEEALVGSSLSTKSPWLDWQDTPALSLGTSIPQQGSDLDSYFGIAMVRLGGSLKNMAWSGSHARYDVAGDAFDISTIKSLSMTEDDRQAGLAAHGPSSAYDDSFDLVTKASQMTCDYRIDAKFAAAPYKVVFFDHNHNDRNPDFFGTATFETVNIVSVTKGATTQVTLASIGTIVVGNGVVLQLTGIDALNHAAVRVQAVVGNTITINVNSSGYAGTFGTGTCTKYDRATVHGSFRFLYHRLIRAAFLAGVPEPVIIYCGAPSDYTNGVYDTQIRDVAELIKTISDELGCAFFDVASRLNMSLEYQDVYFADTVHPLESYEREVLGNIWGEWLAGGATPIADPSRFVPAPIHSPGTPPVYDDQAPLIYSRFLGGAGTPELLQVGSPTVVFSDNFSGGLGTWTVNGTAPVIVAAPWGSGSAIRCVTDSGTGAPSSYLSRSISVGLGRIVEFDFYLPDISGLTTLPTTQVYFFELRSTGGYYLLGIRPSPSAVVFLNSYFETPNVALHNLSPTPKVVIAADTKYRARFEMHKGASAAEPGHLLFYLDDELVGGPYSLNDFGQNPIAAIRFGAIGSNTGHPFTVYHSNLTVSEIPTASIASRVTGTLSGIDFVGGWAVGGSGTSGLTSGAWTPSFAFTTPGDSVITHTTQVGKYLKLGNFVLFMMDLQFNTNAYATASGQAEVSGLPFAAAVLDGSAAFGALSLVTYTANAQDVKLRVISGGTTLRVQLVGSNAAFATAGIANFPASKTGILLRATGMYWTNA